MIILPIDIHHCKSHNSLMIMSKFCILMHIPHIMSFLILINIYYRNLNLLNLICMLCNHFLKYKKSINLNIIHIIDWSDNIPYYKMHILLDPMEDIICNFMKLNIYNIVKLLIHNQRGNWYNFNFCYKKHLIDILYHLISNLICKEVHA